ncbi:MAG: type I secretion C-terminal target domain-containing protein [Cellvibrionaceae bacterium]
MITITAAGVTAAVNDFETAPNSGVYNVTMTDGSGDTTAANITLNETNVNDNTPEFRSGSDVAGDAPNVDSYDFGILSEGSTSGTSVGTVVADDGDLPSDVLSYRFDGGSLINGVFTINANTGEITLNQDIDDADLGNFNLSVEVSDDGFVTTGDTASVVIELANVNDAPVIDLDTDNSTASGSDFVTSFTEGGSAAYIADVDVNISDVDDTNIESATITIQSVEAGDLLSTGSLPSGIVASSYNPVTGVMTLTGSATLAEYQTAIRAVQFTNDGSSVAVTRSVTVSVNDGDNTSNVATTTINVSTLPTLSIDDVSVQEPESGTTTLTFTISLDQTLATDFTFDYSSVDISALAGSDYVATGASSGVIVAGATSTTVTITVNSDANIYEGDETFSLDLSNFNQTVNYESGAHTTAGGIQGIGTIGANNGAPVATDDSFITAPDTALITGNVFSNDELVDNAALSAFDSTSTGGGTVSDNGDGTFTYTPASGFVGTDTFTYTLTDDDGETSTATVSVEVTSAVVTPPVVSNVPDTTFTENGEPVKLLPGTSLSDADSTTLSSVVVEMTGYIPSQDMLDFLAAGTSVVGTVNVTGNVWELTLTGGADINEYLAVLNTLSYDNSSENPSTATRDITVTAYDEQYNNVFSSDAGSLAVIAVNDAPIVTDNDVFTAESTNDNALGIVAPTDFDSDDSTLVITVTSLPPTVGTVMLADGVTPVTLGQVLTIAELTGLVFDAGTVEGTEAFTYTVSDGDIVTTGTTTIDVGTTNADFATVYEGGLAGGSQVGDAFVSGNLLDNDAIATSAIDSVDFNGTNYTASGGVITVDTPLGVLTVYADNSTPGKAVGEYDYQLEVTDGTSNDVTEQFTYNFTSGIAYSDDLTITIIDDLPIANDLEEDIPESEEKVFNLVFTLDVSGSMDTTVGSTGQSRFDLARQALEALAQEYFGQSTRVDVTLNTFSSNATEIGTYQNITDLQAALNGLSTGGQTDYRDAVNLIESVFTGDISGQNTADDVQNISYFLSDGEPYLTNGDDPSPVGTGFDSYVNSNSIDSYAVGIGTGLPGDLSDLNYIHNVDSLGQGNGHVDDALIVSDVSLLESELLSTVPTAFGGNITFNGSIPNILFGADDGYVESIALDLVSGNRTFTFDGTTITTPPGIGVVNGSELTLSSSNVGDGFGFGTFTFDFADGTYLFSAPNGTAPATFNFDYTVLDGDGDSASAMATINIIDDVPDARDDLDSYQAGDAIEGNVINGLGTDAGPKFGTGFTPFAAQGGGIDKIVDDATVTEFTFMGSEISLDLNFVLGPAPSGTSESVLLDSQGAINASQFNIVGSAGLTFNQEGGTGVGVTGGQTSNLSNDETLTVNFDSGDLPYGINNLVLTISDFQDGNGDQVTVDIYNTAGTLIGTEVQNATNGNAETVDLSAYSGVGSVVVRETGGGWDIQLQNIAYDPAPATEVLVETGGNNGSNLSWVYSHEVDINGNDVFQATVTDSDDGSVFIMRSNGYYEYEPVPAVIPVTPDAVATTSAANVTASDLTLTGFDSGGGSATLIYSGEGVTIQGGGNDDRIDDGETLSIDFTSKGGNIFGVENIVFDLTSASAGETVTYTIYALDGVTVLGTENSSADPFTISATEYSQIGRIDFTADTGGTWVRLQNISFDELQSAPPTTESPVFVDYTLTDSDGQSDTARLSLYSIDNEITGTVGADNIAGGATNDAIIGDAGNDTLSGGDGHDNISGGSGLDLLVGGLGDDYLSGGDDADELQGGDGSDHLSGDSGDDLLDGGQGDDIALGGDGDDLIFGGAGDDKLQGEAGDDQLFGGAGSDNLSGGDGDDVLIGGTGDDNLLGGHGVDVFKWSFGDGGTAGSPAVDTISDFDPDPTSGGGDALDLRDLLVGESEATLSDFLFVETSGADTVIHVSSDGGFTGGYDSGAEDQTIIIEGIDLVGGLDQSTLIADLITNGKLIID